MIFLFNNYSQKKMRQNIDIQKKKNLELFNYNQELQREINRLQNEIFVLESNPIVKQNKI
jgi:hypothetical protein